MNTLVRTYCSFLLLRNTMSQSRFLYMKKDSVKLYCPYTPKSENQKQYVNHLSNASNKLIFAVGPAGTGKTLFACTQAITQLKTGSISKIVVTRPIVPVEEDLGFLPGNINKKMDPWMRPVFDLFLESFSQREIDGMLQTGVIEISPLAYMRGRTFKNCFIIGDEMQNSSPSQMLMLITRIGVGSRMVITGDLKQSDKGPNSGLADFIQKYRTYKKDTSSIQLIEFDKADIERSPIVAKILDIYDDSVEVYPPSTSLVKYSNKPEDDSNNTNATSSSSNTTPILTPTLVKIKKDNINNKQNSYNYQDAAMIPNSEFFSEHL